MSFEYTTTRRLTEVELRDVRLELERRGVSSTVTDNGFRLSGDGPWGLASVDVTEAVTVIAVHVGSREEQLAIVQSVQDALSAVGVEAIFEDE